MKIVSRATSALPISGTGAEEREIEALIMRHGAAVDLADLPWLGGILGKLRQDGGPLAVEQIARVSAIRGKLARIYHGC
jgi:hypothetical protein